MKVIKFGGSSVKSAKKIKDVKHIIESQQERVLVVVSALQGMTDKLLEMCCLAAAGNQKYLDLLKEIRDIHISMARSLYTSTSLETVLEEIISLLDEMENITEGICRVKDITPKIQDRVLSFGERLSAILITHLVTKGKYIESRQLINTDNTFGNARVNITKTFNNIRDAISDEGDSILITPGFIGSTDHNETTTLGRGGSDYTAALFSAALNVNRLEIWTDVDGFMTADPKKVRKAIAIKALSYAEAMELSHFGARVIYTPTIQPAYKKNIEIAVKNTFNPSAPGTVITKEARSIGESPIKGISSIDDIDLITLQGPGMVGVKGISMRLFGTLANNNVNIILITQASSEYSISFAIHPLDTQKAVTALKKEFEPEIRLRKEINIMVEKSLSIIAIVGEQMKNTPGISATLFQSLGRNGISVIATAQGSSELNISVVIRKKSLKKSLNVIHEGFFLSHIKELHLFLAGIGTVGGILLQQIHNQQKKLLDQLQLKINVVGISNSRKMLVNTDGIKLQDYKNELDKRGEKADMPKLVNTIKKLNLRNSVFIDCTASEPVSEMYNALLDSFVSVVTANKIACSSEYSLYKELKSTALKRDVKFMFETNVGAGLPIITTINDLIKSGDKIIKMEAVLSGTLNFIFNEISSEVSLSRAIMMAKEKGFSEPDPRIDLSGIDVVRKLLILARESGYELEQTDVEITPFLPPGCFEGSLDDFWKKVATYDDEFEKNRQRLEKESKKWRFVARLNKGKADVSLQEVDASHPAYPLEGSNNILLLTTDRYDEQPMVIRGYGAGAEVTAAGVFADIIRIANV